MRPEENGPSGGAPHRMYDADEVDAYICSLQAALSGLQARFDAGAAQSGPSYLPISVVGDTEAMLGQTLLLAQRQADDIVAAAHQRADALLELATIEADECLAGAWMEAQRIVTEARRAIELFLRDWDDQLCDQISEARRHMFGGFGRHSARRRTADDDRTTGTKPHRPLRFSHPDLPGPTAVRATAPPSADVVPIRRPADTGA